MENQYITIDPTTSSTASLHGHLLSSIAPRPIALVSTMDSDGNINLSPYSFYNCFGSNPTTLIFSPARRVRDNTTKHTLQNCQETGYCVINAVNYDIVHQISLSSVEYAKEVNEFEKSGLTMLNSVKVKAPRVAESPVQFECKVREVIETGTQGGAGNLVICEILLTHINQKIVNEQNHIDPNAIDLVGRMGSDYYVRASGAALFTVPKPNTEISIGIDQLPLNIKLSSVFNGSQLALLASVTKIPSQESLKDINTQTAENFEDAQKLAQTMLNNNNVLAAWKLLLPYISK